MKKRVVRLLCILFVVLCAFFFINSLTFIDYEQYKSKIWIAEEEENKNINLSFIITDVGKEHIEGQYLFDTNIILPCKEPKYTFIGDVMGTQIQCQLFDEKKVVGSMILKLSDNKMEVIVDYNNGGRIIDEKMFFRPFTIKDVEGGVVDDFPRVITELDYWGKIEIIVGIVGTQKTYPMAFMINDAGEVLYEFSASYKTGTTIEELYIGDFNEDGLVDVNIITYFEDTDIEPIQWFFYQEDGGTFRLGNVEQ